MEFDIFSIGDSEFLEQVLIALAMLTNVADFTDMVAVGLLIGVFSTMLSAISKGGKEFDIHHVFLGYIIYATMFVPTASVNIEDTYTGDIRRVDNVPIGPAAAGGIISLVGYKITQLFEVAYNPVIPRVTQTQFAESLQLLSSIRTKSTDGSLWKALNADAGGQAVDLRKSWFNYIKDCTLKKIDLAVMTEDDLINTPFIQSLQFNSLLFGTQIWVAPGEVIGRQVTCQQGWEDLYNATNIGDQTTRAFDAVLSLNPGGLMGSPNSRDKTNDALAALLSGATDAQTYMKIAVLEPIVLQAADKKMNQLQDVSGSIMINQAIQQRNTTWAAEQTLFMTIVRPMLAFFEAFTYSVAPVMAFIIVLGAKGIQLAGKYFTTLLWIQLWMPILAIVNLYIYTAATRSLSTYSSLEGHNWDSFYALQATSDITQHWLATGGLLAASTPAIALMLVYGSSVTATHLAGRLKNDRFVDSDTQTPDIVRNGPLLNSSAAYQADMYSGAVRSGLPDFQMALGSQFSQQAQSLNSEAIGYANQMTAGLRGDLVNGSSTGVDKARAAELANATQTLSGKDRSLLDQTTTQIANTYGSEFASSNAVQAIAALQASGAISTPAALQMLKGELSASGQSMNLNSTTEAEKRQQLTSALDSIGATTQDRQSFARSLGASLTESTRYSDSSSWQKTGTLAAAKQLSATASTADQYAEMAARSQQLGISSSIEGAKAAAQVASNPEAFQSLENTFSTLSKVNPGLLQAYNHALQRTTGAFGSETQHKAWSMLKSMSTSNSYASGIHGRETVDRDNERQGMQAVMEAVSSSVGAITPGEGVSPTAPFRNQGVSQKEGIEDSPFNTGQNKALLAQAMPLIPAGPSQLKQPNELKVTPTTASSAVDGAHGSNLNRVGEQDELNSADQQRKEKAATSNFVDSQLMGAVSDYNTRHRNGDGPTPPKLSYLLGSAENAKEFAGTNLARFAEMAKHGAFAASEAMDNRMGNLKSMSPTDVKKYEADLANRYENTEAMSKVAEYASRTNDTIIGALHSLASNDKPAGMSLQAYGDYLTSAYALAKSEGENAAGGISHQLLDAFYNTKIQEANSAGLHGSAARLYASSFSTGMEDLGNQVGAINTFGAVGAMTSAGLAALNMSDSTPSDRFTNALNAYKLDWVPANTDENGYAYEMVNGQKQFVHDENGDNLRHFETFTNESGQKQVRLLNPELEEFTNNAAEEIREKSQLGMDSDRSLTRLAGIEKLKSRDQ